MEIKMKKQNKGIFWKVYAGMTAFLLVAVAAGWFVLWRFLDAYEQSRPEHTAKQVIEMFAQADLEAVWQYTVFPESALEPEEQLKARFEEQLRPGDWELVKLSAEYTKDRPVYLLKKDGIKTAAVYLEKQPHKGAFQTPKWQIDRILPELGPAKDYRITAPAGAQVTVNKTLLDEAYITADGLDEDSAGNAAQYADIPKIIQYTVTGLYEEPVIEAYGSVFGSALPVSVKESHQNGKNCIFYEFSFECDEAFIEEQESYIMDITRKYGNYITNDAGFDTLSPFILKDSEAYQYLKKIALTNVWYSAHTSTEFKNLKTYGYQIYAAACFSCEVSFEHIVHTQTKDFSYPTHIRYIFVKKGENWYVAEFSLL